MAAGAPAVHPESRVLPSLTESATGSGDVVYMLQASYPLRSIDCVTTVKMLVFRNPRHLEWFNRLNHRAKRVMNISLALACLATCVFTVVDLETGRFLSVIAFVLFFLPLVTGFLAMRVDILKLLMTTYEFWYITLNSALTAGLLCVYFGDAARGLLPVVTCVWYVRAFMIDANCSRARATAALLAVGAVSVAIFQLGLLFDTMPATNTFVLFSAGGRVLKCDDMAINGLGIVLLLLVRNAYRKYTKAPPRRRRTAPEATRVRLIGYRTRIRLVEVKNMEQLESIVAEVRPYPVVENVDTTAAVPFTVPRTGSYQPEPTSDSRMSQLTYVAPSTVFSARHVVWPVVFDCLPLRWNNLSIRVLSRSALVLSALSGTLPTDTRLAIAAVSCTAAYCGLSLALCNRPMLWLLLQSFDVQFLVVQHGLAHLTTAYIVYWDSRSLLTLTSWAWFSWVITIDALTPIAKRKLHISRQFLILVFVRVALELVALCFEFTYFPFENRTIFSLNLSKNHAIVVNAIPFFFTRLFSMFWWTWRLLWRVCTQGEDELVVIQGGVEYDDYELYRKFYKRRSMHSTNRQHISMPSTNFETSSH